jgi:anaphase-promoting complex subunit 1
LRAGWAKSPILTLRPPKLKLFNPYLLGSVPSSTGRAMGLKRTLELPHALKGLDNPGTDGQFDLVDGDGKKHRLQLQLLPRNEGVRKALDVCRFALPDFSGEALLALWWNIHKEVSTSLGVNSEWIALIVTIFCLAVDLIDERTARSTEAGQSVKKRFSQKRHSHSAQSVGEHARQPELELHQQFPVDNPAWAWILTSGSPGTAVYDTSLGISQRLRSHDVSDHSQIKNAMIIEGIAFARKLHRVSFNIEATNATRATDQKQEPGNPALVLVRISLALHMLHEEQKLNVLSQNRINIDGADLGPILAQINGWLGWEGWDWSPGGYYDLECCGIGHFIFDDCEFT